MEVYMNLSKLIDSFVNNERNEDVLFYFQEIFNQEGFGQNRFHKYDVLNHTRKLVKQYRKADFISEKVRTYLSEIIDGISKDLLLQVAMCFHDSGKKIMKDSTGSMKGHAEYTVKNQLEEISKRFGFTENQKMYVSNIILYHDFIFSDSEEINKFLKDNHIEAEGFIVSLVDILSTQGEESFGEEDMKRISFGKEKLLNVL